MARGTAWIFLVLLFAPTAAAADGSGEFLAQGAASFPAGSEARFVPLLAFLNGTGGLGAFTLTASAVVVHVFDRPFTGAQASGLSFESFQGSNDRELVLHDVRIRLVEGRHEGYLALLPGAAGEAEVVLDRGGEMRAEPRTEVSTRPYFHTDRVLGRNVEENDPNFYQAVGEPHLRMAPTGRVAFQGAGAVKVHGADLLVASREGEEVFRTGWERRSDGPVHEGARRWLVLEFEEGRWEVESTAPWVLAASTVGTSWEGAAQFRPVTGGLQAGQTEYVSTGAMARLDGRFEAECTPYAGGPDLLFTKLQVRGDLSSTTLRAQASMSSPVGAGPLAGMLSGLPLLVMGAAVVASAVGGYGTARLRRRGGKGRGRFSVEECRDAAAAAAAEADWAEAAEWLGRARRLAPTSARLASDLAHARSMLGAHDAALALYGEASRLSSDGEADLNGALAAVRAGRGAGEVEKWVARALARSPEWVLELEGAEEMAGLAGRPAFEDAVALAWRRVSGVGR